jgi:aminoglycoside phosphotransferase (APT) family kinase protein
MSERILADLGAVLPGATDWAVTAVRGLEPFGDGHSGFTYLTEVEVDAQVQSCVLRLSPPGVRIAGPADIGRQGRIMRSLADSAVPVPEVIACSSEPLIAGRAYMLLERVEGEGYASLEASTSGDDLATRAIAVLRALHAAEPLPDRSEPALSVIDELERWTALLPRAPEEVRRAAEPLHDALAADPPPLSSPCRVHGDFHYGNLLFRHGQVVALLDWEISSLGSPLCDLGSLIVASIRRRYEGEPNSMGNVEVSPARLAQLYGADADEVRWHAACACLKYAAIIGYNFELHRTGKREDPEYLRLRRTMRGLPEDGLAILRDGLVDRH